MKARVIRFQNRLTPAIRQPNPATVVVLPMIRIESYGRTSRRQWRGKRRKQEKQQ